MNDILPKPFTRDGLIRMLEVSLKPATMPCMLANQLMLSRHRNI